VPDPQDSTKTVASPYNAGSSAASNAALTAKAQVDAIASNTDALKQENPKSQNLPVPSDLVTASGSGLDPQISPEGAKYQAARVADARKAKLEDINALIDANTEGKLFGLFGAPNVNVLLLNLALDERWPMH
jgi:K+-transporting ATPase ATPase C chain